MFESYDMSLTEQVVNKTTPHRTMYSTPPESNEQNGSHEPVTSLNGTLDKVDFVMETEVGLVEEVVVGEETVINNHLKGLPFTDHATPLAPTLPELPPSLPPTFPEDSLSSFSQDSEISQPPSIEPPVIKEEVLEYTDGNNNYFYISPEEALEDDSYTNDGPTYVPEQEFTCLPTPLQHANLWNKHDSNFSDVLHNIGLIHKDAAPQIAKLQGIQKNKLSVLLQTWSNQKAFTDCLPSMTDCDFFYGPIGYNSMLVTDPCMSARYDCLTIGLSQQDAERKQFDEFYNFTEEKAFYYQKCKLCQKLFANTFGLRQHSAHMHQGVNYEELYLRKDPNLYNCLRCKKPFPNQVALKRHFKKAHISKSDTNDSNLKCSHCGEFFKTRVILMKHTNEKHRNRAKVHEEVALEPWSCELCKNIFYKKCNFIRHMQKIHGKLKVSERLLNSSKLSTQGQRQRDRDQRDKEEEESLSPKVPTPSKSKGDREKRNSKAAKKLELTPEPVSVKSEEKVEPVTPVHNSNKRERESTHKKDQDKNHKRERESIKPEPETTPVSILQSTDAENKKDVEVNVTCLFCKLCFVSYSDLQHHCTEVHRESNKIILLKMFTIIGSQGVNYQCILCSKVSPTAPIALNHLECVHLILDGEPVKEVMSFLSNVSDLDTLSLKCRYCQKIFKSTKIKRKHEKTVHNDQTIVCFYCFIPIVNRTELTKHIKSEHTGTKCLFKCRWCDAHFSSIPKRCTHMKEYHSNDVANISNPDLEGEEHDPSLYPDSEETRFPCSECNLVFHTITAKSKHERYVHNENVFLNCLYCFSSYRDRDSLAHHIGEYHSGKKLYKCKWCVITFETLYQRCIHMKDHHSIPSATMNKELARERCISEEDLLEIKRQKLDKSPVPFSTPPPQSQQVLTPQQLNNNKIKFEETVKEAPQLVRNCRFCDAEITSMILKKHLIEHRRMDCFCCIFCDKTVPTIGGIKSHVTRNHPFITSRKIDRSEFNKSLDSDLIRVAEIEKQYLSRDEPVAEIVAKEPPSPVLQSLEELVLPCYFCNHIVSISSHVNEHWQSHADLDKPLWSCTLCGEEYTIYNSFYKHIKKHEADPVAVTSINKQNICKFCNTSVETQQILDGHLLIHRTVTDFNCVFCDAKSTIFKDIKDHISQCHLNVLQLENDPSRHLNETPFNSSTFKCSICLKLCNNQFNLNSHTKAHILGGKPCLLCKFKFKDMQALKKHLSQLHGASDEFILSLETGSRNDSVPDYCELCDTSFTSQGKFQKHRRACRDKFKLLNKPLPTQAKDQQDGESTADITHIMKTQLDAMSKERERILSEEVSYPDLDESELNEDDSDSEFPMEIPMSIPATNEMFVVSPPPQKHVLQEDHEDNEREVKLPCEACDVTFTSKKQLYWHKHTKRHLAMEILSRGPNSAQIGKHACEFCLQSFTCKKQLHWHTKIAHIENQGEGSSTEQSPSKDATAVSSVSPVKSTEYYCHICSIHFHTAMELEWHLESENHCERANAENEAPSKLENMQIPDQDMEMLVHDNKSGPVVTPKCPVCNLTFDAVSDLQNHLVTAHFQAKTELPDLGPRRHICTLCNTEYSTNKQLYNHKRTLSHITLAKKSDPSFTISSYKCEECNIDYQSYKQLWNHKKSAQHKEASDPHGLPTMIQSSNIITSPTLRSAKSTDSGEDESKKNFVCLDCDCVFEDRKQMKWHRKTWKHKTITIIDPDRAASDPLLAERDPIILPQKCSNGFICTVENPCELHTEKSTGGQYHCKECNLTFKALRTYTVHSKQHLKEGFKCLLCNQKFQFKNYNNVKRHLYNIHRVLYERTKDYMATFHDYDKSVNDAADDGLKTVRPEDLMPPNEDKSVNQSLDLNQDLLTSDHAVNGGGEDEELVVDLNDLQEEEESEEEEEEVEENREDAEKEDHHIQSTSTPLIRMIKRTNDANGGSAAKRPKFGSSFKPAPISFNLDLQADQLSEEEDVPGPTLSELPLPLPPLSEDTVTKHPLSKRQYCCVLCNTAFTQYLAWWYHSKLEHTFSNVEYYGGSADSKVPGSCNKKDMFGRCTDCKAVFSQHILLEAHLKSVHKKPKVFQCDFCFKKFNSCKNASRHRLNAHSIKISGRKCYLCKLCEKYYPTAAELIDHTHIEHDLMPSAMPGYCCRACGKVYNKESTFVAHIKECEPSDAEGDEVGS